MGVNTTGYIGKEVTALEVYNVIASKYDTEARHNVKIQEDGREYGSIDFMDGEDQRSIFFYRDDESHNHETSISLSYWNNAVDIIANVVKCFGGKLKETDSSDLEAIDIPKDENYSHTDRVKIIEDIMNTLDDSLSGSDKVKISRQIFKHKDQLKKFLID